MPSVKRHALTRAGAGPKRTGRRLKKKKKGPGGTFLSTKLSSGQTHSGQEEQECVIFRNMF